MSTTSAQNTGKKSSTRTWYNTDSLPANDNHKTSAGETAESSTSTQPVWAKRSSSDNTVPFWDNTSTPAWTNDSTSTMIHFWDNDINRSTSAWRNDGSNATNPFWSNSTNTISTWKDVASEFGNSTLNNITPMFWAATTADGTNNTDDTTSTFIAEWNSGFTANLTVDDGDTAYTTTNNNVTEIVTLTPLAALVRFFISTVIITVNVLTIATFCRVKALQTLSNMLTVNLAVADLLVGLIVLLSAFTVIPEFNSESTLCVFRLCWFFVSCCVSMVTICLQGGERYLFIVHPYRHVDLVNVKVISSLIALSWIIGLSFGMTPFLFEYRYSMDVGCDPYYVLGPNHGVYGSIVIFLLTSIPTLVFYSLITRLVLEKRRSVVTVSRPNYSNSSATSTSSLSGGNPNSRHASLRSKLQALKAPAVVFGAFFCCWTPHMAGYGLHDAGILIPRKTRVWLTNLGLINSAMNFFVYLSLNRQFREALSFRAARCCPRIGTIRRVSMGNQSETKAGRINPSCSHDPRPSASRMSEAMEIATTKPYTVPVSASVTTSNQPAENTTMPTTLYSYTNPVSFSFLAEEAACCPLPMVVTPTDVVPQNVCHSYEERLETGQRPCFI